MNVKSIGNIFCYVTIFKALTSIQRSTFVGHSGKEEDFYGDVVPGCYNSKTKKFHIRYFDDEVSEDLTVQQVLRSLHG